VEHLTQFKNKKASINHHAGLTLESYQKAFLSLAYTSKVIWNSILISGIRTWSVVMVVVLGIVDPFLIGFTRMNDSLEKP